MIGMPQCTNGCSRSLALKDGPRLPIVGNLVSIRAKSIVSGGIRGVLSELAAWGGCKGSGGRSRSDKVSLREVSKKLQFLRSEV